MEKMILIPEADFFSKVRNIIKEEIYLANIGSSKEDKLTREQVAKELNYKSLLSVDRLVKHGKNDRFGHNHKLKRHRLGPGAKPFFYRFELDEFVKAISK